MLFDYFKLFPCHEKTDDQKLQETFDYVQLEKTLKVQRSNYYFIQANRPIS